MNYMNYFKRIINTDALIHMDLRVDCGELEEIFLIENFQRTLKIEKNESNKIKKPLFVYEIGLSDFFLWFRVGFNERLIIVF